MSESEIVCIALNDSTVKNNAFCSMFNTDVYGDNVRECLCRGGEVK